MEISNQPKKRIPDRLTRPKIKVDTSCTLTYAAYCGHKTEVLTVPAMNAYWGVEL
jgi:hypothetical protein